MTENEKPKMLDLFCGMGGWSIGFHREGYECTGLDIVDVGYPYTFLQRDIRKQQPPWKGEFDVIVASPPCTEYSPVTKLSAAKGQRPPPDPEKGNELVREAMRIIKEANPKFWALENVYGSRQHIEKILGKPRVEAKPFLLWGNFPEVMWPDRTHSKSFHQELRYRPPYLSKVKHPVTMVEDFPFDPLRSWKRARIPVWVARTLAQACNHTNTSKDES